MASQRLPLLLSLEHLATAQSYWQKRQERLIPRRSIVPQFSPQQICQPRIQRALPLAPTGLRRIIGQRRTVRRQASRTIDRSLTVRNRIRLNQIVHRRRIQTVRLNPTAMNLLTGRKPVHRASVRNPSALLPPEEKQRATQEQQRPQPASLKPEEKKEQPKRDEKPPQ
jgi:hypothetical protein